MPAKRPTPPPTLPACSPSSRNFRVKQPRQTGTGLAAGAGYFVKMFLDMLLMRLIVSIMMREVFGKEADRGFYQVMEAQILGRNTTNVNIGSTNTTRRLSPVERVRADRAVLLDEYYFWKHVVSTTVAPFQEPARAVRKALEPVASLVPQAAGFSARFFLFFFLIFG